VDPQQRYNPLVTDHFENPRNAGRLENPDGVGTAGDASCGDTMSIYIRVRDDVITAITFLCKGCPAAIACGSMTTELAMGKHLDDAAEIADETITQALGGLPADKRHCSNLGAEALASAIMDYVARSVDEELADREA